ncbi:hypothetical protein SAMN05445504_9274 [Burkholderia sp. CF099]|nr:hypothetical protein SAMN05445504_9274 [Burkholderia sp. CF099]
MQSMKSLLAAPGLLSFPRSRAALAQAAQAAKELKEQANLPSNAAPASTVVRTDVRRNDVRAPIDGPTRDLLSMLHGGGR